MKPAVLYESNYDPEHGVTGQIALAVHFARRSTADAYLAARLELARTDPAKLARLVEEECLRGLSDIGRDAGPEHAKRTGRSAGGGTLTRGS